MKRNTILIIIGIVLALAIIIAIVALGGKTEYIDSVSTDDLAMIGKASFETSGGVKLLDDDVILKFTDQELSYLKDYSVIKAKASKNINEFGIFRVEEGHAKDLEAIIKAFVENQQESYRSMNYFPEEIEKIDCATVKVYGNYVIYSFLNEADTEAFYSEIEKTITK